MERPVMKRAVFGMLLDNSGLGDRGYMDMQYKGLVRGCQKYGSEFVLEQRVDESVEATMKVLETLVANGASAIFCTSYSMKEAMMLEAARHPDVLYILMDDTLETYLPNTASATFRVGQAAYLAGYLSVRMSNSKVLGVIAGKDAPPIREFINGYAAGAEKADENAVLLTRFIDQAAPGSIPWNNPAVAYDLAKEMAGKQDADVFFPVAGASGIGVFNFVRETGRYAIGVDSDQDYLAEGFILTSAMKRLDVAVESLVGEVVVGRFENKNYLYQLENGGVGLSPMKYTKDIIPRVVQADLEQMKQELISGAITVPTSVAE